MIDIDIIRNDPERIRSMMVRRNADANVVSAFIAVDEQWRAHMGRSQEIHKRQKEAAAHKDREAGKQLKEELKVVEETLQNLEKERHNLLLEIPNIPFDDVPQGAGENDNVVIREEGTPPTFSFPIKDHIELGESLGIIDSKNGAKVAGSRFYYLRKEGALLEFALTRFAVDMLIKEGFEAVVPPVMIRPDVYERMGRLTQSQKEERYYLPADDLYLVGSAEHTLGPLLMDETLSPDELPRRFVGFSSCFRREAGSYGKDVKGILRVHQFEKVEMYSFVTPEQSEEEHRFLLAIQEKLYKALSIPYRVVAICVGDMGPTDARQFDIEAWIPSQHTYREVASCSNTTDYQTRGIGTRVKYNNGSNEFAHALNATAIAMTRTIIAILENFQQKDGSIKIPSALKKYTGFKYIKA